MTTKPSPLPPGEIAILIEAMRAGASVADVAALLGRPFTTVNVTRRELINAGVLEDRPAMWDSGKTRILEAMIKAGRTDEQLAVAFACPVIAMTARRARLEKSSTATKRHGAATPFSGDVERIVSDASPDHTSWPCDEHGVYYRTITAA